MRNSIFFAASAAVAVFLSVATYSTPASAISCAALRADYLSAPAPKAWANAKNDSCGSATGRIVSTLGEARAKALEFCQGAGGIGCRIGASAAR